MFLNPAAFNSHLQHMGQKFVWRKAFRCPCVNEFSGAADPGCPNCSGKSWFWDGPVDAVAGVASQQTQLRWAQFGLWQDGDIVVSIPESSAMYDMGQFDRALLLNSTDTFSLPLTRGGPTERITDPVEKVTRVFWLNAQKEVVDGALPVVDANGVPTWAEGGPPIGTTYTITGKRYNEYFCWGPYPSNRMEHQGARLPKRVVLRKFDLFDQDL